MTGAAAHQRALEAFELEDIFIIDFRCHVARDLNQTAAHPEVRFLHRFEPQTDGLVQHRRHVDGTGEHWVFRYYIDGGLRLIRPDVPADRDQFTDEDVLAEMNGVIAVDYVSTRDLREDREAISAFATNAVFHAWSYWRAMVMCRAAEMRLPRLVLPMLRQAKKMAVQLEAPSKD